MAPNPQVRPEAGGIEAPLEELQERLAGDALHRARLDVVAVELPLGEAVDALQLLLLAQLGAVVGQLPATGLSMLPGCIGAPLVATLVGIATVAFEEQLHVLTATEATNGTGILRHL